MKERPIKAPKEKVLKDLKDLKEQDQFHYSEDRDARVKDTGEVFTPPELINKMLAELDYDFANPDDTKTWLDPTCGSGNFLVELAKKGVKIKNIYGVDLMDDNVQTTKERLTKICLKNGEDLNDIEYHLSRNIVQGDALTYHYNFHEADEGGVW